MRFVIKISDLTPHLLYQFKSEHELVTTIQAISEAFTTNREKIDQYLTDPKFVSAYTLFYLSTNEPKLQAAMELLPKNYTALWKEMNLVDVGAGPGTFSLAWAKLFNPTNIFQIESARLMQQQSTKLLSALYPNIKVHLNQTQAMDKKMLLFGHSLNEMCVEEGIKLVLRENPQQVLLIEPGTSEVFKMCMSFRDKIQASGYKIVYPCSSQASCPMINSTDWCHQFLDVRHDVSVERLTQLVKKDRKLLPILIHLYVKEEFFKEADSFHIVRVLPETKFSFEWEICFNSNGQNVIEQWQVMKKDYSKTLQKGISSWRAGKEVKLIEKKSVGDIVRVKLDLADE